MKESALEVKTKSFAKKVIYVCRVLREKKVEYPIIDQFLRSGTSIGANLYEARYAHGTKDFIAKLEIALKECNESNYWIDILHEIESLSDEEYQSLNNDVIAIRRMLVASVTTLKNKE